LSSKIHKETSTIKLFEFDLQFFLKNPVESFISGFFFLSLDDFYFLVYSQIIENDEMLNLSRTVAGYFFLLTSSWL